MLHRLGGSPARGGGQELVVGVAVILLLKYFRMGCFHEPLYLASDVSHTHTEYGG